MQKNKYFTENLTGDSIVIEWCTTEYLESGESFAMLKEYKILYLTRANAIIYEDDNALIIVLTKTKKSFQVDKTDVISVNSF